MTIKLPARRNFLKYGMAAALGAAAFPLSGAGPAFSHTFPAHSLTVLTLHS